MHYRQWQDNVVSAGVVERGEIDIDASSGQERSCVFP